MSSQPTLTWPDGLGWLILSSEQSDSIRAQTLQRLKPKGGVAYLGLRESSADATMDDFEDLGAPTGYLVNILVEDDEQIQAALREVSLIVLDGTEDPQRLYDALQGAALDAVRTAYDKGTVILAEGRAAALFGGQWFDERGALQKGMNWLKGALILPSVAERSTLRAQAQPVFQDDPYAVAVGIPNDGALVLGPDGSLELWGDQPIAVTFGPGYLKS